MHREWQPSSLPCPLDHAADAHAAERRAALVDEDVSSLNALGCIGAPEVAQRLVLVALEIETAVGAALEAPDDHRASAKVDIVPSLRHPQTMPVDQEADQPVAVAMPIALERRQEFVDFGLGQVLANPVIDIRLSPFDATGRFSMFQLT
jgi:hypothetical protein